MKRVQQTGYALGSDVLLTIILSKSDETREPFDVLWGYITAFEKQFSRFLPDSELTRFNKLAGAKVPVTPSFLKLLRAAKKLGQTTGGLYNPFILPGLQRAGYVGSWPRPGVYDKTLDYSDRRAHAATDELIIDGDTAQIPAQAALDFGGIGKGYLLDELARILKSLGIEQYWLSIGGDIICKGNDMDNKPWEIAIASAEPAGETVGYFTNDGKQLAVATSGITKRKGTKAGKDWHHIIDPQTGKSAQTDVLVASVTTTKAVDADVFAKCLVILNSKHAKAFIAQHGIKRALLQVKSGDSIVAHRYGGA